MPKRGLLAAIPSLVVALLCFLIILLTQSTGSGATERLPAGLTPSQPIETSKDVHYGIQGTPTGPPAPHLSYPDDYGTFGGFQSRTIIWVLAQQHNFLGGFVLGVLVLITLLELRGILMRNREAAQRDDEIAFELLGIVLLVLSLAAISGGVLLFGLLSFYPGLMRYFVTVLRSILFFYGTLLIFVSLTVYLYYLTWNRMKSGNSKWVHASIGLLSNTFGLLLMFFANAWTTFMISPSGVDDRGRYLGNSWRVIHNTLWMPFNIHRFFGDILFGSAVVAGYAAYRTMTAKSPDDKARYDRMGSVAFLAVVLSFLILPFGGYMLKREIYAYRQQMGMTLSGGLLAWLFILLVDLIGCLFIGMNYYLWQRIDLSPGGERYGKQAKIVLLVLTVCFLVYLTPHTIVMTPAELKAMGGAQHPIVGNYGTMSAKNTAANIMILTTVWSLLVWWKCRYRITQSADRLGSVLLGALFLGGAANIIYLGIYGYFIPANVRIGLSVPMALSTLTVIVLGSLITLWHIRGGERATSPWKPVSNLGNYALLFIAVAVTWINGVAGYIRSSVRLHWHVTEILRDNSPWAFTNPIGYVGNIVSLNVLLFWSMISIIFWLVRLKDRTFEKRNLIPQAKPFAKEES
jgi:cytochrome d ubiquinol oxidase subunit I